MQNKINIKLVQKSGEIQKFDDSGIYWGLDQFYNNKTFINIAVGGRGIGKTFTIKRRMIDRFIENKRRFVYIRYFDSELNPEEFFAKITNYYENTEFGYGTKKPGEPIRLYINNEVAGYMVAVKTAYKAKSIDFINVDTIHFDEFLAPIGTLGLPEHSPAILMELLETILRNSDDSEVKVFLTANAVAIDNEFFDFFHVPIEELGQIKGKCIKISDLISFEYCLTTDKFIDKKSKTNLGRLFQSTGHWNYAIDNNFVEGVLPKLLKGSEKIGYKKNLGFCIKYDDGYLIVSHSNFKYKYMVEYKKELPQLSNSYHCLTFDLGLSDKRFIFEEKNKFDEERAKLYDAIRFNDVRFDSQTAFTRCLNWFHLTTKW
jgi:hypothetical protein